VKAHTFDTLGRTEVTAWFGLPLGISFHRYRVYVDAERVDWTTFWLMNFPGGFTIGGRPPQWAMRLFKIEGHPHGGAVWTKLPKDEFLAMVKALNYREGSK
jgi:hypothetical protein